MTYTISALPQRSVRARAAGRRPGRRRVPVGRRAHHRRQRAVRREQPDDLVLTPEPVDGRAQRPGAADDRPADRRVHGRHLSRSVRQPARRLRSRMPLTLDITVDAGTSRSAGSSGCCTGPSASTTRRCRTRRPRSTRVELFYDRDEATFDPSTSRSRSRTSPAPTSTVDCKAGKRSIWIMPAPGTAESFETTVIDPDTHRAVPFTVQRETLRYRFFATAGTFPPPTTSSEPEPGFVAKAPIRLESEYRLPTREPDRDRRGRAGGGHDLDRRARRPRRRILAAAQPAPDVAPP